MYVKLKKILLEFLFIFELENTKIFIKLYKMGGGTSFTLTPHHSFEGRNVILKNKVKFELEHIIQKIFQYLKLGKGGQGLKMASRPQY